jgi:predicted MPP superfamily phosphohydrolase
VITLLNQLTPIAPTYYAPGNHEWTGAYNNGHKDLIEAIRKTDAVYLENSYKRVKIGTNILYIGGVFGYEKTILETDWSKNMLDKFNAETGFKLLLCHFPNLFADTLKDYSFDLALCGHAHGGQIRLPFTEGLWCENQGLFPKYTSGLHQMNNTLVCISRGLGNKNHRLPRINNQPELVVVDIN